MLPIFISTPAIITYYLLLKQEAPTKTVEAEKFP